MAAAGPDQHHATIARDADLEAFRSYLMRYALLQLRDRSAAEDVVQETLLAALEGKSASSGQSSVSTWLTGILKHKIIDRVRRAARVFVMREVMELTTAEN